MNDLVYVKKPEKCYNCTSTRLKEGKNMLGIKIYYCPYCGFQMAQNQPKELIK